MTGIMSQFPSMGPRIERLFLAVDDGVEAVLDVWEHDHAWSVGSGYTDEDSIFDRHDPVTRENARQEAARRLDDYHSALETVAED